MLTEVDIHAVAELLSGAAHDAVTSRVHLAAGVAAASKGQTLDALLVGGACTYINSVNMRETPT